MKDFYLSYLMGADTVTDSDITSLGIIVENTDQDGDYSLKILAEKLSQYIDLVKAKLNEGFWNEIVGAEKIFFIFKFKDGSVQEHILSLDNEAEISKLCSEFNGDPLEKTANVYRYISGNKFYQDFMMEHYVDLINRK